MISKTYKTYALLFIVLIILLASCTDTPLNSPYQDNENNRNILYSSFAERPKHLDPVRSYSSNEYAFIGQIYEPLFQYHYLKRPYELIPLTAEYIPKPIYLDKNGNTIKNNDKTKQIEKIVYEIKIKEGIIFQNHPAFAKDENGNYLYHNLKESDMKNIYELSDFKNTSTRELTAEDYLYQIKRMANPKLHNPIFPILADYIDGFKEYSKTLSKQLKKIREERKNSQGAIYNQEQDEQDNPILLDIKSSNIKGVKVLDKYTLQITLKKKYPQFIYWMAMPFFAPMPWEAEAFYTQGLLIMKQISLNWYPIGTGPYRLAVNNPNKEMILLKNENFHRELYPSEGFSGAKELGLLDDAGKTLPFIEKAIYKLEKETIPYWSKFLQGYYDTSGINSDSFDSAVRINIDGDAGVTPIMKKKGIRLSTSAQTSTYYIGFNMLDDKIGGYSEKQKKLRQAISIAYDYEEYIQIFLNGRGIPAQSPLPPGIFGHIEGCEGRNPYVYDCINGKLIRKPISEAKRLLSEAGYANGKDKKTGEQLLLYFDTMSTGPDAKSYLDWLRKQFKKIDIQLVIRATDYNRFQDKMIKGSAQIYGWGWNADYPDPENFLFLLYGPNKKVKNRGENASNYENPRFDTLYEKMANITNSPKRLTIIKKLLTILHEDSPWLFGFHPISYGLYHEWYQNAYPNLMANNTLKYKKIDFVERSKKRYIWNKPVLWPVYLIGLFILVALYPIIIKIKNKE